jgi:hypothetical protein
VWDGQVVGELEECVVNGVGWLVIGLYTLAI